MTHETFRELLPLYVIGALDGAELRDFEQYVAANRTRCEAEIAEFQAVANQLAFAAPAVKPPDKVFDRILADIEEKPRRKAVEQPEAESANLVTLFMRWIPWTVAFGLCLVVLAAVWRLNEQSKVVKDFRQRDALLASANTELRSKLDEQTRTLQAEVEELRTANNHLTRERDELRQRMERQDLKVASLQRDFERQRSTLDMMMDPALHVGQLADPSGKSTATAKVYWQSSNQSGLVVVSKMSPIVQGGPKTLELWAICGDQAPIPAGVFWTDASGHGVVDIKLAKQVACAPKFAVSIEPAGGVDSPSGPIVLLGQ
jgi:anti-sigma-K factor RskA